MNQLFKESTAMVESVRSSAELAKEILSGAVRSIDATFGMDYSRKNPHLMGKVIAIIYDDYSEKRAAL